VGVGFLAGLERFDLECFDGLEVFGIGGDDSEFVLDGGGGDERIGELQVMREKVFFDEPGGALPANGRLRLIARRRRRLLRSGQAAFRLPPSNGMNPAFTASRITSSTTDPSSA
jgi:hypothetical protein